MSFITEGKMTALRRAIALIVLVVLAIIAGKVYFSDLEYRVLTKRVERIIDRDLKYAGKQMGLLRDTGFESSSVEYLINTINVAELKNRGITLLLYAENQLSFWTDNAFDPPEKHSDFNDKMPVEFIHNSYFLKDQIEYNDTVLVALLRIFNIYEIENRMIRNGFISNHGLPDGLTIALTPEVSDHHVFEDEHGYLFSIVYPEKMENSLPMLIPVGLWVAAFIMLLLLADSMVIFFDGLAGRPAALGIKIVFYASLYLVILYCTIPDVIRNTELFKPGQFYMGRFVPGMGYLLIISVLLADIARTAYKYNETRERKDHHIARDFLAFTLYLLPGTLMLIAFHQVFTYVVSQPNLVFEGYRIAEIRFPAVAGLLSVYILILVPCFYILKVLTAFSELKLWAVALGVLLNMVLLPDAALFGVYTGVVFALFYLSVFIVLKIYAAKGIGIINLALLFSLLFSLYSTLYISQTSLNNEYDNLKVLAVSYASDHDPVADHLLIHQSSQIMSDTTLKNMVGRRLSGSEEIREVSDYLREEYFNGYWTNYDFSIVVCSEESSLISESGETIAVNCFSFFEDWMRNEGETITGTSFCLMDNNLGRPYYAGKFYFNIPEGGVNGLFIELFSFVNAFREGYPELLVDKMYTRPARLKSYSYAKYAVGNLVLNTGDFSYPRNEWEFEESQDDYHLFERDGFDHLIYRQGETTVILSRPVISVFNRIISFAYIFLFILIISSVAATIYRKKPGEKLFSFDFRIKLQSAFLVIILFIFIGISAGAAYLSVEQYRARHYDNLREKARSVNIELEHKLDSEPTLDYGWSDGKYYSLSDLLVKFSNVFFTDINLYDRDGMLLATSRPEIFARDLIGHRMDKLALMTLGGLSETEYVSSERIGELDFLSIYVPFFNERNELLAYLNIPYFRMQSILAAEISNLIVAIVNFSLLMVLLTGGLAVFISKRITYPLRMLRDVLSSVKLGTKSVRLTYNSDDEIGDLVKQYNCMVEELDESARKLSVSEREYAWREMAKQIAHEIKNPLTPMKLNIQQLEKTWKDGTPGFERKLEKFTRNQIEYIDSLSSIATAFSNFAKIPKAEPVQVDLLEQIKTTIELFGNTGNVSFRISCSHASKVIVYADREHLNSIFSNLVKNSIQSIPEGRSGLIRIAISLVSDRAVVQIADNGTGIPDYVKEKLFTPYFTTKSAGSGLGLSIVKRLVEGTGGSVSFESESDSGTVFTVTLPVLYSVE